MCIFRRSILYLTRKKGKSVILFFLFFFISVTLVFGISVLIGTQQAAKDLRSNIGAAFYIRPYERFKGNSGELISMGTPFVTQDSIEEIKDITGGELKEYNTEHYGYAKGEGISFVAGMGDTKDSNMGKVTAVRSSELTEDFLNGNYTLSEGRHIKPDDNNKILITKELAAKNGLKIGDVIELTHADFDIVNNVYVDLIREKNAFSRVEVVGIYEIRNNSDEMLAPTPAMAVNHILSDSRLLIQLGEQTQNIFEGQISFFIADPLNLSEIIEKIKSVSTIDWGNHILVDNDFQYSKIAWKLSSVQKSVFTVIALSCALSITVLILILMMRARGRVHEAGILLAVGKTKSEIIGQFVIEAAILLLASFIFALALIIPSFNFLNEFLFGSVAADLPTAALRRAESTTDYLQPHTFMIICIFSGESAAVILAVVLSCARILSMKPKEILTKTS